MRLFGKALYLVCLLSSKLVQSHPNAAPEELQPVSGLGDPASWTSETGNTLIARQNDARGPIYVSRSAKGCLSTRRTAQALRARPKLAARQNSCPAPPYDDDDDEDGYRVYFVEFFQQAFPIGAFHQVILVSDMSKISDTIYHVTGNVLIEKLQFEKRPHFKIGNRPLSDYRLAGHIIPSTNLPKFEAAIQSIEPPGPGIICGNCQRWTRRALWRAVQVGAMIPHGSLDWLN